MTSVTGDTAQGESRRIPGAWLATVLIAAALLAIASLRVARPVRIDRAVPVARAAPAGTPLPDMRIELNTASPAELAILPGIGPQLADRIVRDRESRGAFASVADLDRVNGIGPAIVARVDPYAVVD